VELLRHREKILGEESEVLYVDAKLAGAGTEEISFDPDMVADVEKFIKLPELVANGVFLDVDLELFAGLLKVRKAGFSHQTDGDEASCYGDGDALGLKLLAGAGGVRS
jgi:hypothetical protein